MTDHNQELVERVARAIQRENRPKNDCRNADQRMADEDTTLEAYKSLARAAIAAAQSDGVWQPIETAPKDGRYLIVAKFTDQVLGWVKHSRWITADEIADIEGGEADDYDAGWTDGNHDDEACFPTHWAALSAPEPVEEQG